MDLPIIYQDNHLLVVNKPAGLLTQGDASGDETLVDRAGAYLKAEFAKPGGVYVGLVHRLDRNVGGVMVLAKTSKAAGRLSAQFREGTVRKTYQAVVDGIPRPSASEAVAWLAAKGDRHGRTLVSDQPFAGAREGRLYYEVVAVAGAFAQIQVRPITGRRHQIRAQMAQRGYPLLGDVKYDSAWRLPHHRLALHATRLELFHPVGGRALVYEAPLPAHWPWPDPLQEARQR